MRPRLIAAAVLALVILPGTGRAQPDDALFLRELLKATRTAADELRLRETSPELARGLEPFLARLALAADAEGKLSFRTLSRMDHAPFDRDRSRDTGAALLADWDSLRFYLNVEIIPRYDSEFGPARRAELFAPRESLTVHRLQRALNANTEALRRYELKYGPGAPRLNWLEASLNHLLQSSSRFGPGAAGPGPWELIAGYSSSYATLADEEMRAVSVVEAGFRYYIFAPGWGSDTGWTSYLRPRFVTFGLLVAGARDGALRGPGDAGGNRWGGFLSWGGLKAGYVSGDEERFMLSRQIHLLPNLF